MNRRNFRKIGRLRSWHALAKHVLLLLPGLLIDRPKAVGIGGLMRPAVERPAEFRRGIGRRRQNAITRRGQFPGRHLLVDALQDDQDFFRAALHPAGRDDRSP